MPTCRDFFPRIKVFCSNPNCKEQSFEEDLKPEAILNIEEGPQREDILTFICPNCGHTARSKRYGS